jgi:hypothetical protein
MAQTETSPPDRPVARKYGSDAHFVYHSEAYEPEPAKHFRELFRPFVIRQVSGSVCPRNNVTSMPLHRAKERPS